MATGRRRPPAILSQVTTSGNSISGRRYSPSGSMILSRKCGRRLGLHQRPGLGEQRTQNGLDRVELLLPADQWRGHLDDGVAAVVCAPADRLEDPVGKCSPRPGKSLLRTVSLPADRDHTPPVLRPRGAQVVADVPLVVQEFLGDDGAADMPAGTFLPGRQPVPEEARHLVDAAWFERATQHVVFIDRLLRISRPNLRNPAVAGGVAERVGRIDSPRSPLLDRCHVNKGPEHRVPRHHHALRTFRFGLFSWCHRAR
jgi:hypothetical protein